MFKLFIRSKTSQSVIKLSFLLYSIILFSTFIFAAIFHKTWVNYLSIYHTILELSCVFIALAIFVSVWYTYQHNSVTNYILGFGYLAVAIFDALHTFFHLKLNLTPGSYFDLSTRYWILGRLTEALVMLLSLHIIKVKPNKFTSLAITLFVALGSSLYVIKYHNTLPLLLTEKGVTSIKVALEYIIIFLYLSSLYKLNKMLNKNDTVTYKYIFLALLMSISAEFCFTKYTTIMSITWTIGHLLKIISYYFLLKGIFKSSVTYPYQKLEAEYKRYEAANREIKQMSETLNDILDALPIGIQMYDSSYKLKYINKRFEELLGYNRKDLVGLTAAELPESFPKIENSKESNSPIMMYKNLRGDNVKLSFNLHNIRNGALAIFNDAKKEQELENINLQTQTILNSVSNGILVINRDRKVVLCNRALEESLEMDKNEIIGMDIDKLYSLLEFGGMRLLDSVLKGDVLKPSYPVSLTTVNGNKKELLLYLTAIKNIEGEIIGGICVSNDVSELKKEQEKQIQQEKLALLGQMGAGIVHETRNYLTTIKGCSQLIDMLTKEENTKKYAGKIDNSVNEVNKIISEFLFMSKPREAEMKEVSLIDIFESLKSMLETWSLMKSINVDFHLSKEERYLLCDETQLKQVILNICKNAVDAMIDTKNAKLSVRTKFKEETNEMHISITDNGKGISEQDLKKIGTAFFTTKSTGTGLGLNVCYKIINEHKGRIEVKSKLNAGTTFTVVLPCIEDEDEYYEIENYNSVIA